MTEFSSFTSIFEIFAIVYISVSTIKDVLLELIKPMVVNYQKEKQDLIETIKLFKSFSIEDPYNNIWDNLYNYFSKKLQKYHDELTEQGELEEDAINNEIARLTLKYRPIFFYTSLYCFVCLILNGLDGNFYAHFFYRFMIFSYFLLISHLRLTRKKTLEELELIGTCKNWLFNITYLFSFIVISFLLLGFLTITNIIDFYYFIVNSSIPINPTLFVTVVSILIFIVLFILYFLYTNFFNRVGYIIIAAISIELIVRSANINTFFGWNFNVHSLNDHKDLIITAGVVFVFIPIFRLFLENFVPSTITKIRLRLTNIFIKAISKKNEKRFEERTGIDTNESSVIGRLKLSRTVKAIIGLIIVISVSYFGYFYFTTNNQLKMGFAIRNVIKKANEKEFKFYVSAHEKLDTILLTESFLKNSPAYKKIFLYAYTQRLNNNQLCEMSSSYSINSLKVVYDVNNPRVETEETWNLEWYNPKDKTIKTVYNKTNKHTYWLEKDGNIWKISTDDYVGEDEELFGSSFCAQ